MTYERDRAWSDSHFEAAKRIILLALVDANVITVRRSSESEDQTQATDGVLSTDRGDVGMRFRRETDFRDFTLRLSRPEGTKTEVEKVKEGWPRWYFYGWTERDVLREWVFVDMDKFRSVADLGPPELERRAKKNKDGTEFAVWTLKEIGQAILKRGNEPPPKLDPANILLARKLFKYLNGLTVGDPRGSWSAGEIAASVGIPEKDAQRIIEMLVTQGFLVGSTRYGPRISDTTPFGQPFALKSPSQEAHPGYRVAQVRCLLSDEECRDWRGLPVPYHEENHRHGFPF